MLKSKSSLFCFHDHISKKKRELLKYCQMWKKFWFNMINYRLEQLEREKKEKEEREQQEREEKRSQVHIFEWTCFTSV
jgi:hypothetical protein